MEASKQQLTFIAYRLFQNKEYADWIKELFNQTPKNNEKYPDDRCDYKQLILADRIKSMTQNQADYVIKAYTGIRGYSLIKARNIIINSLDK